MTGKDFKAIVVQIPDDAIVVGGSGDEYLVEVLMDPQVHIAIDGTKLVQLDTCGPATFKQSIGPEPFTFIRTS